MYNYNLINPINITYRNPKQDPAFKKGAEGENSDDAKTPVSMDENKNQRHFPNGNKVQIDYTKNTVNIAQVVEDFKSTIAAINAPKNVSDEVHSYLNLVEMESKKENPSREIILTNLKNASKISDKFIEESLKKPSTVVEDWVNALFLQHVELKSDPSFVNEAFRVQIPDNKKGASDGAITGGSQSEALVGISGRQADVINGRASSVNNADGYNSLHGASSSVYNVPENAYRQESSMVQHTENALNTVSSANDFQNSAVNIYDIPQQKVTLNEIKPIGSMPDNYYVGTPAINVPLGVSTDDKLTYSTTAPLLSTNVQKEAAVSFAGQSISDDAAYKAEAQNEIYQINSPIPGKLNAAKIPVLNNAINNAGVDSVQEFSGSRAAKSNMARAKRVVKENNDPYSALKLYDQALRLVENSGDENLKAAIHFERGKVFDDYDYADLALRDYNKATKCSDYNLKTHAHLKMGRIYDDYVMFDPAVEQYSLAVETSEEAKNPNGKTRALRYLAALFADRYDKENTANFNALSIDAAYETGNSKTIAKTLMDAAENFEHVGEDAKALGAYKNAAKVLYSMKDYNMLSRNYEAASEIMERLGNGTKAMNLLSKALQYRQKAELQTGGKAIPA